MLQPFLRLDLRRSTLFPQAMGPRDLESPDWLSPPVQLVVCKRTIATRNAPDLERKLVVLANRKGRYTLGQNLGVTFKLSKRFDWRKKATDGIRDTQVDGCGFQCFD